MKNIQNCNFYKKSYISIIVARCPLPLKTVMSSHKWFVAVFFQKYCLFRKTCLIIVLIKKVILIFGIRRLLSLKNGQMPRQNSFLQFLQKILLLSKKLFIKTFRTDFTNRKKLLLIEIKFNYQLKITAS